MAKPRKRAGSSSNSDDYWRLVLARRKSGAAYPFQGGVSGFVELMKDFLADRIPLEEFTEVFELQYSNASWAYDDPARDILYQVIKALQDYTYYSGDEPRDEVLRREVERVLDEDLARP